MEGSGGDILPDCKVTWLLVEADLRGTITDKTKLKYALQCSGRNPFQSTIDKYWNRFGGSVNFSQFCTIMRREKLPTMSDLMSLFKRLDRNGDGYLSADELRHILTKEGEPMSLEEVESIISDVDINKDGKLDYNEFCHMVLETTEDCMRVAQVKTGHISDKEERRDKERKKKKLKERRSKPKRDDKELRDRGHLPSVIYRTGSGASNETEIHSSMEDLSSDLPVVSPTSLEPTTPPFESDEEKESKHHTLENETQIKENPPSSDTGQEISTNKIDSDPSIEGSGDVDQLHSPGNLNGGTVNVGGNDSDDSVAEEIEEEIEDKNEVGLSSQKPPIPNQSLSKKSDKSIKKKEELKTVKENEEDSSNEVKTKQNVQQPDHLPTYDGVHEITGGPIYAPTAPKPPKKVNEWNSIQGKGCFYIDNQEEGDNPVIISHQYILTIPESTHVWIEMKVTPPGNPSTDIGLYLFQMTKQEEPAQFIAYTLHRILGYKWVCRLDLEPGSYILLPFTSGCVLQVQDDDEEDVKEDVPLVNEKDGKLVLTSQCIDALSEIFQRHDLDGNGAISRNEFDFFYERIGKELCDDESWKALQDNFQMNNDEELTINGFIDLHTLTANDENEGETEIWNILKNMGYNKQLQLNKACPFEFEVFTEECDGEIEILPMTTSALYIDVALSLLAKEMGVAGNVRDAGEDVVTHTLVSPHMTTIVIENKSSKNCSIQVDCSRSTNSLFNRDSAVHIIELTPQSLKVAYYLVPEFPNQPHQVIFIASLIKT